MDRYIIKTTPQNIEVIDVDQSHFMYNKLLFSKIKEIVFLVKNQEKWKMRSYRVNIYGKGVESASKSIQLITL